MFPFVLLVCARAIYDEQCANCRLGTENAVIVKTVGDVDAYSADSTTSSTGVVIWNSVSSVEQVPCSTLTSGRAPGVVTGSSGSGCVA